MGATSDAVTGGIISGVVSGVVAGVVAARATVNKLKSKIKGDGNILAQGNTGPVNIYASPFPPQTSGKVGPYLLPRRVNNRFVVRNDGDDYAVSPTWTASATDGPSSVIPSGIALPNPMGPGIETEIALDGKTFGSGVTTIEVNWADTAGRLYSNRLNV